MKLICLLVLTLAQWLVLVFGLQWAQERVQIKNINSPVTACLSRQAPEWTML